LKKSTELLPEDAKMWTNLGSVYQAMKDKENAITAFRKAKEFAFRYPGLDQQLDQMISALENQ